MLSFGFHGIKYFLQPRNKDSKEKDSEKVCEREREKEKRKEGNGRGRGRKDKRITIFRISSFAHSLQVNECFQETVHFHKMREW